MAESKGKNFIEQIQSVEFSELEFEHIGVWPFPLRILILVALVVVLLIGGYYFHIKDLNVELASHQAKELKLKNSYKEKAHLVANLEIYKQQMIELEQSFGVLLGQLPKDTEVPSLLEDITEIGHGSSLNIQSIALQPEQPSEFYIQLPIKISVQGGYHDFGTFVSGIANLSRIVTLHDFEIKPIDKGGLLSMNIMAKTYRYKTVEE